MKQHADKNRSERTFQVGDMVYLKVQPYIQSTVVQRSNQKLSYRYFGPYKVLARVGEVAYRLELPAEAKIHPVVHVSQLKRQPTGEAQVHSDISDLSQDPDAVISPLQFLDSKTVRRAASAITQLKVVWSGMPSSFASWEEINQLCRRFPRTPA